MKSLLSLLRFNGRHSLWFPRGYKDQWFPKLDPLESCSHGKNHKRTLYLHEPIWLWRLRQRLFCVRGRQRCGRREESVFGMSPQYGGDKPLPDTCDLGPDGNRTCSYCGSIHPDDLMAICRKTLTDERYGVEGTTKSYKVYVRQPGVRNAGEGAIKFYMHHAPAEPSKQEQEIFSAALRATTERFNALLPRAVGGGWGQP